MRVLKGVRMRGRRRRHDGVQRKTMERERNYISLKEETEEEEETA